ncbi:glutathione S-transferase N-terminal domain-containing protein [Sinorhizobium sp. BG8]|uniref:glutathione S-transferase family protein n=1 Tax=Sinorhizobium sp. BG8 TaxID=2613773 RepID=UPI00193E384F|nr:glutathione S-transferase N-terminal domain-containing protein [Sinorhizobium sp. BG8]QRM54638.1 glutathione S-transferase [Sinorhizobium sp. BG8]
MLTLYYAPRTCALASLIALEESGTPFQVEKVDFSTSAQRSPAYLKINPKGRVPALATGRGIITETPAILAYIAHIGSQRRLAPIEDAFAFAEMQAFNAYLASTVHVAHAHMRRGQRWSDDAAAIETMKAKVPENMTECFRLIEEGMLQGPWVMGERYSVADPYLFTFAGWLKGDGVEPSLFPRIAEHRERMLGRPAVERAMALEGA